MNSKRDNLIRTVFPLLRSQLAARLINVHEIDLRWGITESETDQSLGLCLRQVLNCDYFICMLGDRYGHTPSDYTSADELNLPWLRAYPIGASITELEVQCQVNKKLGTEDEF